MMRRILMLLFVSLLVAGCFKSNLLKKKSQPVVTRPEVQKLNITKKNPDVYWGEGIATIENNDLGQARELAKKRALEDLARKVEVHVQQDISRVIQTTMNGNSETISELFNEKVHIYTQSVLTDTRDLFVMDYPAPGNCTMLVYMSRAAYQQKVNRDLKMKKEAVRTAVQNGNAALARNEFMIAATHWASAYNQLKNFFGDLPVQDDLDGDSQPEEIHAYLQKQMNQLLGNIELHFLESEITYDATGTLTQKPIVQARYLSSQNREIFVPNLPLKVDFVSGKGRIMGRPLTNKYGTCELDLKVDASYPQTTIAVSIDRQAINGLERFNLSQLSEAQMTINKIKTVAISVSFYNQDTKTAPKDLMNEIKSMLLSHGYLTIDFSLSSSQLSSNDFQQAAQSNADFLLVVFVRSSKGATVGGYANLYATTVSGEAALYRLPRGDQIAVERLPSVKGFGASASVAGWDGFGKIKQKLLQKAQTIIQEKL